MNYSSYIPTDMVNGTGIRASLFVSGCSHGCEGCYNEKSFNPKFGSKFTSDHLNKIIADLKDTKIVRKGLSLLGGDPLYKKNLEVILSIVMVVKEECPDKDIWLWTGYTQEEVNQDNSEYGGLRREIMKYVDVLIDGRFEQDKYDPELRFRGSSNQNIIYLSANAE